MLKIRNILLMGMAIIVLFTTSCGSPPAPEANCTCPGSNDARVDSRTAVLIARGATQHALDSNKVDVTVANDDEFWKVEFRLKPEYSGLTGSEGFVDVSKQTGEVQTKCLPCSLGPISDMNCNCPVLNEGPIDQQVAILIARAFVWRELDMKSVNVTAADDGDAWKVEFRLKPSFKNWIGGGAIVGVNKQTGEIGKAYISK